MFSFSSTFTPNPDKVPKTYSLTREIKKDDSLKHTLYSWLEGVNSILPQEGIVITTPREPWQDLESELFEGDCIITAQDKEGSIYHCNITQGTMMKLKPDASGECLDVEYYEKVEFTPVTPEPDNNTLIVDKASFTITRRVPFCNEKGEPLP